MFLLCKTSYVKISFWGPVNNPLSQRYMALDMNQAATTGNFVGCLLTGYLCPSSSADILYHVPCVQCIVSETVPPQTCN
jgi:uncharacterized protein YdbL (DUF1318 family)